MDMLDLVFETGDIGFEKHAKADPDIDSLSGDARFQAMLDAAEARIAAEGQRQ